MRLDPSGVSVQAFFAQVVNIIGAEATNDHLTIMTLGGDDTVDASRLAASLIQLTLDGRDGNDDLTGGAGNNTLLGGAGGCNHELHE